MLLQWTTRITGRTSYFKQRSRMGDEVISDPSETNNSVSMFDHQKGTTDYKYLKMARTFAI